MEDSILKSVKKALGIAEDSFDDEIIMHINSTLALISQLGGGPALGYAIEDENDEWKDFLGTDPRTSFVRTYVFAKVRQMFDPPATGFHTTSLQSVISEYESRLNLLFETEGIVSDA